MKGNQGLEALAALCGGAKRADESRPMRTTNSTPTDMLMTHQQRAPPGTGVGDGSTHGAEASAYSSAPLTASVTTSDQHHVGSSSQAASHAPPTSGERGAQGVNTFAPSQQQQAVDAFQRQWQQAMAAAAAYSAVPSPAAASAAAAFLSAATGGAMATLGPVRSPAPQSQQQQVQTQSTTQPPPQLAPSPAPPPPQPQTQTQPQAQQPQSQPGATAVVTTGGDGALQQLAYYQYIQAHAAAAAQAAHAVQLSQQPPTTSAQLPQQVYHQSSSQELKTEGAPATVEQTLPGSRTFTPGAPPTAASVQQATTTPSRPIHRESPNQQEPTPLTQQPLHQLHHDPQKAASEQGNGGRIMGPPVIPQAPPGQQLSQPHAQAPMQGTMQPPPPVPQSISPPCSNPVQSHVRVAPTPASASVVAAPLPIAAATPLVQMRDAKVDETVSNSGDHACQATSDDGSTPMENKKQLKRAANRRSAQLSRKRKKQFIEELKDENDELRRKEQILRSIPDLIVVFDSAGRLWFVSDSVTRFLEFTPQELDGSSFWERLCDESVRLLKAAFMDALAARQKDSDTAPLGSGVWELRLVDKDGSHKAVTLNGVVHFSGEAPECVCSIRPCEDVDPSLEPKQVPRPSLLGASKTFQQGSDGAMVSHFSAPVDGNGNLLQYQKPNQTLTAISPQQSFTSSSSSDDATVKSSGRAIAAAPGVGAEGVNLPQHGTRRSVVRVAAQISDGDSVSESGSDE